MSEKKDSERMVTFEVTTQAKTPTQERDYIKVRIPRFSGGTANDWLDWHRQFDHLAKAKKWSTESKAKHLDLLLEDEALEEWEAAKKQLDIKVQDNYNAAYQRWGMLFVPMMYNEQLEEELFLFAKRRNETAAECHQRLRVISRKLSNLPSNALTLDDTSLIRTFKRGMPNEWKIAYEHSGILLNTMPKAVQYFERLEQSERRQGKERRSSNGKPSSGPQNNNRGRSNTHGSNKGSHGQQTQQTQQGRKPKNARWCKLHKTSSHSDSECFTQQKNATAPKNASPAITSTAAKKTEEARRTETQTKWEDQDSEYAFSGDSECKVIDRMVAAKPGKRPPMRLRVRLSKTPDIRITLVDTRYGKSYVSGKVLEANMKLGGEISGLSIKWKGKCMQKELPL